MMTYELFEKSICINLTYLVQDTNCSTDAVNRMESYFDDVSELIFMTLSTYLVDVLETEDVIEIIEDEISYIEDKCLADIRTEYEASAWNNVEKYINEVIDECEESLQDTYIQNYYVNVYHDAERIGNTVFKYIYTLFKNHHFLFTNLTIKNVVRKYNDYFIIKMCGYKIKTDNRYQRSNRMHADLSALDFTV